MLEKWLEKCFKLKKNGTTVQTELLAGFTTFFAMAYVLFVNPDILASTGMDYQAVMIATCISAAVGTLLTAFMSNKPFAQAPAMGLNAFFAFTVCGSMGYSWQNALAMTLVCGILFLLVTLSPMKDKIIRCIPSNLKYAIAAGIGLFIALLGLLNSGIVVMQNGLPALGDVRSLDVQLALLGLLLTAVLMICKVKGGMLISILGITALAVLVGAKPMPTQLFSPPTALADTALQLTFAGIIKDTSPVLGQVFTVITLIISMMILDMFTTVGFLVGAGARSNMIDEQGNFEGSTQAMQADALATIAGALLGTSTVTTYAESATGMGEGGRTGLTGVVVSILFLLCLFFSPLASIVPSAATASALIVVGMYLLSDVTKISFEQMDDALPAFLTIILIPLTYSVTNGMGFGFIAYVLCKLFAKKAKQISPILLGICLLFVLYFIL